MRGELRVTPNLEFLRDGCEIADETLLLVALSPTVISAVGPELPLDALIRMRQHVRPVEHHEHGLRGIPAEDGLDEVTRGFQNHTHGNGDVVDVLGRLVVIGGVHRHEGLVAVVDNHHRVSAGELGVVRLLREGAVSAIDDHDGRAETGETGRTPVRLPWAQEESERSGIGARKPGGPRPQEGIFQGGIGRRSAKRESRNENRVVVKGREADLGPGTHGEGVARVMIRGRVHE